MYRILTILIGLIYFSCSAQTVSDFTFVDINGDSYNLYENLEQGKAVGIYFFFVNCGFCQTTTPMMQTIFANEGPDCLDIIALSVDQNDTESAIQTYKDSKGAEFDFFTSAGTNNQVFGILSQHFGNSIDTPSFLLVNPDKSVEAQHMGISEFSASAATDVNALVSDLNCATTINNPLDLGLTIQQTGSGSWAITNETQNNYELSFLSPAGRIVAQSQLNPGANLLSPSIPAGLYFIHFHSGNTQYFKTVMKY